MRNSNSKNGSSRSLVRPSVEKLSPYVPGEQPKIKGLVKLNTNENPYGPAPKVLSAIQKAVDGRLRLYPNPTAAKLREKLARLHGCTPDHLIVGNGSDELLAMATRAFVEPVRLAVKDVETTWAAKQAPRSGRLQSDASFLAATTTRVPSECIVQFFSPSYSLYPVLAEIHGAQTRSVPLGKGFALPGLPELQGSGWDFDAALTFVTTPNAPTGRGYTRNELDTLCRSQRGVIVLDEAYVDFAAESALDLALRYPHVLVSRTFSKAYSLCALRIGYFVGDPQLILALQKIRDSYNVNMLGQVAAEATLGTLPYYRKNFRRIIASRQKVSRQLATLGFDVLPSQTNFVFVRPGAETAEWWTQELRERKILVRWFNLPQVSEYLRITIGSEEEIEQLLKAARAIAGKRS